ncbi:MAG: HAD family hydrolase [Spirochaetia bacterium]|nr:HAD family hydrolase [Spirochaetia bacterium]
MIRAFVFDFDGLILDTETADFKSWEEIYLEHGAKLPLEVWSAFIGTKDPFDPHGLLESKIGKPLDREKIRSRRHARLNELILAEKILPGVKATLSSAKEHSLKLAVASSSSRKWVLGHLERLGIADHFSAIHTADDVVRTKPDPALYFLAVKSLGVEPGEALAFEDSLNGLRAAKSAGLYCAVVPNRMTRAMDFREADLRLERMSDAVLPELLARFS